MAFKYAAQVNAAQQGQNGEALAALLDVNGSHTSTLLASLNSNWSDVRSSYWEEHPR
jgi:hypothetical protein